MLCIDNTLKQIIMKRLIYFLLLLVGLVSFKASAGPVDWTAEIKNSGTENPVVVISATIAPGYHLYAPSSPEGGPVPLQFFFDDLKGVSLSGKPVANKKYSKEYNDIFEVDEHFFTGSVTFTQKLKPIAEKFSLKIELKGQACVDGACMPLNFSKTLSGTAKLAAKEEAPVEDKAVDNAETPAEEVAEETAVASTDSVPATASPAGNADLWANVESEFDAAEADATEDASLIYIFIAGFIGGLLALVTPCVWPMIPMTMSFFLKKKKGSKKNAVMTASLYGISIIVIYVSLGLIITAVFGASALNDLATNAIFNIIFFALLVLFAISFLGGFELTLPASWTNKMDSRVDATTGFLSLFFMAFTLVLVSFSCTGPIIGTLLVEAASTNNFLSPSIGMFGFALALALPFTLFALFPSVLKSMPKSGGWLNSVKVVLGFLELALALKFLSVADLAYGWRILDREVFLSLWIVIFALLGVYLLGKITFPHDDKVEKIGITRFMLACISLAFAVYMIPGLWGAPLKSISAFAPPAHTQDFSLFEGDVSAQTDDYEQGMELARKLNKPVLIDFSGHGCVNCRKMEAAVWTDTKVKDMIDNDYVLITLMVDEKQSLPEPIEVTERDGTVRKLRTVGDKWSYLQRYKFGANAQPYHVLVDNDGHPLAAPYTYDENVDKYIKFLESGLKRYNK
jgi:thiol:disulfide interchange protein DsbD